ncbi:hypothetical protein D3C71_2229060 [compost metagenome]
MYRRYQADTKLTASVTVDGKEFEYYPAPDSFLKLSAKTGQRHDIEVEFTANEDGSNPRSVKG